LASPSINRATGGRLFVARADRFQKKVANAFRPTAALALRNLGSSDRTASADRRAFFSPPRRGSRERAAASRPKKKKPGRALPAFAGARPVPDSDARPCSSLVLAGSSRCWGEREASVVTGGRQSWNRIAAGPGARRAGEPSSKIELSSSAQLQLRYVLFVSRSTLNGNDCDVNFAALEVEARVTVTLQ
jgi:hypothetical protein